MKGSICIFLIVLKAAWVICGDHAASRREGRQGTTSQFVCNSCGPIVGGTGCCASCVDNFGVTTLSTNMGSMCSSCSIISNYPNTFTCTTCTSSSACGVPAPSTALVKVCRFAQVNTGDHWYSTNCSINVGTNYVAEKPMGQCTVGNVNNQLPLYEYLSAGSKEHFYTTNAAEAQIFVAYKNYTYNGFVCSVWPRLTAGTNWPLYRFSNNMYTPYLLTIDPSDVGTSNYWTLEYTVGYVVIAS